MDNKKSAPKMILIVFIFIFLKDSNLPSSNKMYNMPWHPVFGVCSKWNTLYVRTAMWRKSRLHSFVCKLIVLWLYVSLSHFLWNLRNFYFKAWQSLLLRCSYLNTAQVWWSLAVQDRWNRGGGNLCLYGFYADILSHH